MVAVFGVLRLGLGIVGWARSLAWLLDCLRRCCRQVLGAVSAGSGNLEQSRKQRKYDK